MDLGSVAIIAVVAGVAGGAVGAALVGTVEGLLRQRAAQMDHGTKDARGQWRGWRVSTRRTSYQPPTSPRQELDPDARNVVTLARHEAIQLMAKASLKAELWGFSRAVRADVEELVRLDDDCVPGAAPGAIGALTVASCPPGSPKSQAR